MLSIVPKELFSRLMIGRTWISVILVMFLVSFLANWQSAFGQCSDPNFAPAANFAVGDGPQQMAVGDFNNDGKRDLAVPNFNVDSVTILLGNGAGSFMLGGNYPVGHHPTSAAAGDFNGDGKLDLAVVNFTSFGTGDMSILIGTGTGSFGAPTSYRVIAFNNSVTVGDLNNDGKLDIVAGTYSENLGNVKVLLGDGIGNFGAIADFGGNGDGYSAVVGDFNSDGKGDVAIAINSEFGSIDFGTGTKIQVLLGDGSGHLGTPTNFTVGTGPTSIAVGDLNGDGKLDLAVANVESDNVSVLLGNGMGSFGAATNFAVQDFPNSVAVGDLNGDSKPDLAVSNARSGTVSVLLGDGNGGFSTPTNLAVGAQPVSVLLTDFSGDGKSDLAVANVGSDNVSILINTCTSGGPNPIDDARFFVRQHYLDFLNREPDAGGWDYWTEQITSCGSDALCVHQRRIGVSAAFFVELEFQRTGYVVYRMHRAAFGTWPNTMTRANLVFAQFMADRSLLPEGANLAQGTIDYANSFVQRPEVLSAYPASHTNAQFVNQLFDTAGLIPYMAERQQQIDAMNNNGKTRAQVLLDVVEINEFKTREYNPSFVLMQYFGYLRRDPDQPGYDFWLNILDNREPNNFRGMVCSFLTSAEYQLRFGTEVTRFNRDCAQ